MKPQAAAIVVAGGQGRRFSSALRGRKDLPAGRQVRKQYLTLSGRPLLWWSVKAFQNSPSIGVVVLVVPADDLPRVQRQYPGKAALKPVYVVAGGASRADSVRQGLAAVPAGFRWIAVHDAVRPLVTPTLIESVLKTARLHRAAIAATPSKDTVKVSKGLVIDRTLPRESVWMAQTPQAFERGLLERAHRRRSRAAATDDSMLVERLGVRVRLVASPAENIKVTLPADLIIAERLMKGRA